MVKFTPDEKKLIDCAKKAIVKYNKLRKANGGIDTLYSFVMSDSGKIYDGACLESNLSNGSLCAERHAIANMILKESYKAKVKAIVIADPVPKVQKNSTLPCGTCRHIIREFGKANTSVICIQYIELKNEWTFSKIEKYKICELYPHSYTPVKWD